ncbi:MAG: amino acid adenylation domain-containing protein [Gammaproteobacteria bacterium]
MADYLSNSPQGPLSNEEYAQIVSWNNTSSDYDHDKSLIQSFEEIVEKNPHAIALKYNENELTYRELNERANQLAHFIKSKITVKSTKVIGICLEPSFELLIGIIAILKMGLAYLPLEVSHPSARLEYILEDANINVLLTASNLLNKFPHAKSMLLALDDNESEINSAPSNNLSIHINKNDLAYIIYTSGSTGKPKGVMITHQNVNHFFHWFQKAIEPAQKDIFDLSSSISFDFSVPMSIFPLVQGSKIAICSEQDKKDPITFIKHLIKNKVTIMKVTPSYFRQLKEFVEKNQIFPDLRLIIFGGETLLKSDINDWITRFPDQIIMTEYGPTEATVASSWLLINKKNINEFRDVIPIGKPALNTQMYILNDELKMLPVEKKGEIYIAGEGVAYGYLNREKMTLKKFINNPFSKNSNDKMYKTGDLGRYLPDGNIEFIGRIDHQIKIRGFRVELEEIKNCIMKHPSIKQAVVTVKEENKGLEKKLLAYCIKANKATTQQELREFVLEHLPEYMAPTAFIFINDFPLTKNGKVDIKKLTEIEPNENKEISEPVTEYEKEVQKIWMSVLHLDKVGVDDNFFDLGGDSLLAARIINKIRKFSNKDVHMNDFYDTGTVAELAKILKNKSDIAPKKDLQDKNYDQLKIYPLSEMQLLFWLLQNFSSKLKVQNITHRRRINGKLDIAKLKSAFTSLFKYHPILTYYIPSINPVQIKQNKIDFNIDVNDIAKLSESDQHTTLLNSLKELENSISWKKGKPLIAARLFYLSDTVSELQIALAHIISDDISSNIVFDDLSEIYSENKGEGEIAKFKDYVILEQNDISTLSRDIKYWEDYFKDGTNVNFSSSDVMNQEETNHIGATTYLPIPEINLKKLTELASQSRFNLSDLLFASVAISLKKYLTNSHSKKMVMSFVKSIRDNEQYDNSIGIFFRTDMIKIDLSNYSDLSDLALHIKKSKIETASYQYCPSIIKLSSSLKKYWMNKKIKITLINILTFIIAKIFRKAKLRQEVLSMYGKVFIANNHDFFVNVNILDIFLSSKKPQRKAFGFQELKVENYQSEKMAAPNVFDVWFDRDEQMQPCLIINANLQPKLREKIGKEIIRILS